MRRVGMIAALGLLLTTLSFARQSPDPPSPFGISMGMMKDQLKIEKEISQYKYQLTSVAKPHTELEVYAVTATPMAGVCFIRAVSPNWKTASDGAILRSRFEAMKSQLEGIYGPPKLLDSLEEGSTLNKPKDWMNALLKDERKLLARWSSEDKLPMKPTITKIYVAAYAVSPESGYIAVEYYFDNYMQCQEELKSAL